jgi:hypothetical protein
MRRFCNHHFGYIRLRLAAGLLIVIGLVSFAAIRWSPKRVVERNQTALIEALEGRSQRKLRRLISPEYEDRWGFDRDDVITSILDVGGQFFVLAVIPSVTEYAVEKREATVTSKLEISGSGSPIAHQAIRFAHRLKEPFLFSWRKESFWPGDWKLAQLENRDLPGDLYGYQPGDIGAAMREY